MSKSCKQCGQTKPETQFRPTRNFCRLCEAARRVSKRDHENSNPNLGFSRKGLTENDHPTFEESYHGRVDDGRSEEKQETQPTILVIGDTHFPFHNQESLERVFEIARESKPDSIVQIGDLYDLYSFSKYPRSHNLDTPAKELDRAASRAQDMWRELGEIVPYADCYQLMGNHDARAFKRLMEKAPEFESLVEDSLRELFSFPGVTTVTEPELIINDICFIHGFLPFGKHVERTGMNTVTGHTHRGGVTFSPKAWELNAGFIGDIHAPVFSYHALRRFHWTTQGVGLIDRYGPRFIRFD